MNFYPLYNTFKSISKILRDSDIVNLGADTNSINTSHDVQKNIDFLTNDLLKECIKDIPEIIGLVSEEDKEFILLKPDAKRGYVLVFDPLDGSKNVYSNLTMGTIYGIYEYDVQADKIISIYESGYALYGPSTILVKTDNNQRVNQYYLNKENQFKLVRELKSIKKHNICSVNLSYNIDKDYQNLVNTLIQNGCTQRWSGAMVADAHQVIMRGGTFIYPQNDKNPNGKIRILYEAFPFAHIFTVLGGCALDTNYQNILSKLPLIKLKTGKMLHGEIPIILSTAMNQEEINTILEINDIIKC